MYCDFYGFSEKPFDVTPDPNFLYLGAQYRELLASLIYGIRERRGLVALVGEVGMGKTTLLNAVLDRLDQKTKVAFISNTDLTFEQLLSMVVLELGIAESGEEISKVDALNRLNDFAMEQLAQGGGVVIIVDEAQNLDARSLENLRLLSNLETRKHKLIQIILAGQPELDVKLNRPELRQLFQRISVKRYITPLGKEETDDYIQDRLVLADYRGRSLFSRKAQEIIWKYSGGVPRKINILCDNALLIGYDQGKKTIDKAVMAEAVKDLSWSPFSRTGDAPAPPADGRRTKARQVRPVLAVAGSDCRPGGCGFPGGVGRVFPGRHQRKPSRGQGHRLPQNGPGRDHGKDVRAGSPGRQNLRPGGYDNVFRNTGHAG